MGQFCESTVPQIADILRSAIAPWHKGGRPLGRLGVAPADFSLNWRRNRWRIEREETDEPDWSGNDPIRQAEPAA